MHRSDLERRVLAYLDDRDAESVRLLQDLVRVRSLARQEGTTSQPGTLIARLRPELGQTGAIEVVEQSLGPTSQNLIEVLGGGGDQCFVIDAHTDTVPEGQASRWFEGDPFSAADGSPNGAGSMGRPTPMAF